MVVNQVLVSLPGSHCETDTWIIENPPTMRGQSINLEGNSKYIYRSSIKLQDISHAGWHNPPHHSSRDDVLRYTISTMKTSGQMGELVTRSIQH